MLGFFTKTHQSDCPRYGIILAAAFFALVFLIRPIPSFADNGASIASGSAITEDCITRMIDASGTTETRCSNERDGYIITFIEIGVFALAAAETLIFFKK